MYLRNIGGRLASFDGAQRWRLSRRKIGRSWWRSQLAPDLCLCLRQRAHKMISQLFARNNHTSNKYSSGSLQHHLFAYFAKICQDPVLSFKVCNTVPLVVSAPVQSILNGFLLRSAQQTEARRARRPSGLWSVDRTTKSTKTLWALVNAAPVDRPPMDSLRRRWRRRQLSRRVGADGPPRRRRRFIDRR